MLANMVAVIRRVENVRLLPHSQFAERVVESLNHLVDALQSAQAGAVPGVVVSDVGGVLAREVGDPGAGGGVGSGRVESGVPRDLGVGEKVGVSCGGDWGGLHSGGAGVVAVDVFVYDVDVAVRGDGGDGEHEGRACADGVVEEAVGFGGEDVG